jgi:ABC-type sugar transport system ATPase subunit
MTGKSLKLSKIHRMKSVPEKIGSYVDNLQSESRSECQYARKPGEIIGLGGLEGQGSLNFCDQSMERYPWRAGQSQLLQKSRL